MASLDEIRESGAIQVHNGTTAVNKGTRDCKPYNYSNHRLPIALSGALLVL